MTTPTRTDSREYERGFCDGWRDRAEYARRGGLTFDDGHALGYAAGYEAALADEAGILLVLLGQLGCDEKWLRLLADVLAGESRARGIGWRGAVHQHDRITRLPTLRAFWDRYGREPKSGEAA